ncbi:MAG: hypothetical protein V4654_11150 [Bdellovibrionota bacterium]
MKTTKKNLLKYIVFSFVIAAYVLSCAPKAQETDRKTPDVPMIGSNDVNLIQLHKKPFADFLYTEKHLTKTSSDLKSEAMYLMKIGNAVGDEIAVDTAQGIFNQSAQKAVLGKLNMPDSQYLLLVEQQSDAALSSGLNETEKTVLSDTDRINQIIDQNSGPTSKVTSSTAFALQISLADQMIANVLRQIESTELFPELKTQVLAELSLQTTEQLKAPKELSAQLASVKTLTQAIVILRNYIVVNQTVLTPEDVQDLANAEKLGKLTDNIHDGESALAALAMAWSMLDAEERKANFQTANKELYDFLKKKDDKEIACLIREKSCGIFKKIVLKVGVFPALKDYGYGNIENDLNAGGISGVTAVVQTQSALQISALNTQIKEKIKVSITEKLTGLHDFKLKFKLIIGEGLAKEIGSNQLDLFENDDFESMFKMAYNQAENLSAKNLDTQFILVEKMLQFMKRGTPLTSAPQSDDIKTVLKATDPRFYVHPTPNELGEVVTRAKDQAWSLMFYSKMIQQLADWKTTSYDTGITKFVAQDFITEFQSEELKKQLFPKAELVGMALSLAAQTLKQMYTDKSPIYLLDKNNNRVSIQAYLEANFDSTTNIVVHAAVSDLQNGVLIDTAKLSDICLMIEAMDLFYKTTEGIEQSKSESLRDPALRTEVLNARKQIRLVIMTLGNFISNQLVDKEKNLYSEMNFQTEDKLQATTSAEYAHAIEALLKAYDLTGIDIYKFAAVEMFYSLNRKFYSPSLKFYRETTEQTQSTVPRLHVLEVLSSVLGIRKHLGITSQIQFDRIFENWYASVLM